jgi:hypothetical protein
MQRDMDYVRDLLLKIEVEPVSIENSSDLLPAGASDEDLQRLNYHLEMMIDEAGFIKAIESHSLSDQQWLNLQLTWHGHEFLETVRDPEVWKRTKDGAKKAGNFGLSFVVELAKAYGKHVAKERLGIDLT